MEIEEISVFNSLEGPPKFSDKVGLFYSLLSYKQHKCCMCGKIFRFTFPSVSEEKYIVKESKTLLSREGKR